MTEESSNTSHLSVVITTNGIDKTQTTGGNIVAADDGVYWRVAVIFIGLVGTAGNALILYALVVSKQHKKHMLIVNQNALDLFSSFFLILFIMLQLCNIYLEGVLGYWLCITVLGENLIWWGTNGSMVNLAIITIDRYLMVVHAVWSRKWLKPWVIYSAMAFSWFSGTVFNTLIVVFSAEVVDGVCYTYLFEDPVSQMIGILFYMAFFYVVILVMFIFFYWRILVKIRNQAKVMASHGTGGSRTAQAQNQQIQTNVIKTMVIVSAFYAISWLPYNFYSLFSSIRGIIPISFADNAYFITSFIAFFYTSANPFIYATKFNPVKEVLKKMIPCKKTPTHATV